MSHLIRLGVNVDHVATLRQVRMTTYPDPSKLAQAAIAGGADGITIHLREDRRHIQDNDVRLLMSSINKPINLEITYTRAMVELAQELRPHAVCLVPERREELTTEGGLDVAAHLEPLRAATAQLGSQGIRVAFFIDPDEQQIHAVQACGATIVELHTGAYAQSGDLNELARLQTAASFAKSLGFQVHAGHGLHYHNVTPITQIPEIEELNIGHSIVAYALEVGMMQAVREMKQRLQ
jgi:pyridoxine 5-phosphate synthase